MMKTEVHITEQKTLYLFL